MDQPSSPTILAYSPFDPKSDAQRLHKAIKGSGTNEKTLVEILTHRTAVQRKEISDVYRGLYKKQLLEDVKSDTSGNFYRVFQSLLQPPELNDAQDLHHAMKGLGTDEDTIQEILFTRTNLELHAIDKVYFDLYKTPLETAITKDTSGDFQDLLLDVAKGNRVVGNYYDPAEVNAEAKELYEAGPKRRGTDEWTYKHIFATRTFPFLRHVFQAFETIANMTIEEAIKSEMSGDTQKAFLALAAIARNTEGYFADQIHRATKSGTKDRKLIRIFVSRSEKDLGGIAQQYQKQFGETLEALIEKKTTSDYKTVMLEILKGP